MPPANKFQYVSLITGLIVWLVLLQSEPKLDAPSFYDLPLDDFSDHCDMKHWGEVEGLYDPDFARSLYEVCSQLLRLNSSMMLQPTPLVRLNVIQHLGQERPTLWKSYIQKVMDATRVKIVVATYDRPSALYNALTVMDLLVSGASVTVLYDASTPDGLKAYAAVLSEFPHVQAGIRSEQGGYFAALQKVASEDISHILVAADDTTFIRPVNLARVAALMMLLGDGKRQEYTVSTQLRVAYPYSSREKPSNIIGKLLLADDTYIFMANCSKGLGVPEYLVECYDRHIDGPLYSIHQIRKEWALLPGEPVHPGDLEGLWMSYKNGAQPNTVDYSLYAADQVLLNNGMSLGTVRDDRKYLEDPNFIADQERLRSDEVQALLNGCRQRPYDHMEVYLMQRGAQHVSTPVMEWHCPPQ
jgi:hypothetical protein